MSAQPLFQADLGDLRDAHQEVRAAACGLERPRWLRAALILAVLRQRNIVRQWASSNLPVPVRLPFGRPEYLDALADLFEAPSTSVLRTDRPDGAWAALGKPERVILDPLSNAGKGLGPPSLLTVTTRASPAPPLPRDPTIQLRFGDRCLRWNPPTALCNCGGAVPNEFNISNDFNQQQGIACCFPESALRGLSPTALGALIEAPRDLCPHRDNPSRECRLNGRRCADKGAGSPGTGGPKILLSDAAGSLNERLMAPESIEVLTGVATANGAASRPVGRHMALITSWAHQGPSGSSNPRIRADYTRLTSLAGHAAAQTLFAP